MSKSKSKRLSVQKQMGAIIVALADQTTRKPETGSYINDRNYFCRSFQSGIFSPISLWICGFCARSSSWEAKKSYFRLPNYQSTSSKLQSWPVADPRRHLVIRQLFHHSCKTETLAYMKCHKLPLSRRSRRHPPIWWRWKNVKRVRLQVMLLWFGSRYTYRPW